MKKQNKMKLLHKWGFILLNIACSFLTKVNSTTCALGCITFSSSKKSPMRLISSIKNIFLSNYPFLLHTPLLMFLVFLYRNVLWIKGSAIYYLQSPPPSFSIDPSPIRLSLILSHYKWSLQITKDLHIGKSNGHASDRAFIAMSAAFSVVHSFIFLENKTVNSEYF